MVWCDGTARRLFIVLFLVGTGLSLGGCAVGTSTPSRLTLERGSFDRLTGWREDRVAAAIPAFAKSCAVFLRQPDTSPLDPKLGSGDFGRVGDWWAPCTAAASLPAGDEAAARGFLESAFVPMLAGNNGDSAGLFTGYYEASLNGSRERGGSFQTPLYRRPPEPTRHSRAEIEDGALAGQGLELLWVDSPVDAFFLEIQGSGQVRLPDGGTVRLGYDGANDRAYVAVGRLLIDRGAIPRERMSMAAIRDWMAAHPTAAAALRRENPSYVFFRENPAEGPVGSEGVVLTPGRSLAVDRGFLPLGVPIWLEAEQRYGSGGARRLVVAQDTGGAIKGPVRGDLFWGAGDEAAALAGGMNARGRYHVLVPRGAE